MKKNILAGLLSLALLIPCGVASHAAESADTLLGHQIYTYTFSAQKQPVIFSEPVENGTYRITVFGGRTSYAAFNDMTYYADANGEITFEADIQNKTLALQCDSGISKIEASPVLQFDFGANEDSTDWRSVSASDAYTANKGYGFHTPQNIKNVTASGEGALSDAVEFTAFGVTSENTFDVDLPSGMYKIKVTAGDIQRMSVACEGYYAIMNMTGNNASAEIILPVTDGQLNLLATEGKTDTPFTISALEISKIADGVKEKTMIFVGGDSTVSTYYPLEPAELTPNVQGGWGQMIQDYVSDDYYVINYATGGQFAKGFLTSGQFDAVEHYMKPGDYFIVAFGINDANYSNEEEYKASMLEMIRRVKRKGGIPVVVTAQGRLTDFDANGIFYKPDRWYKNSTKAAALEENIHFIDLHALSSAYFTAIGKEDTTGLYWINWQGKQDTLHINREGAAHCARLLIEEMINQGLLTRDCTSSYGSSPDITLKIISSIRTTDLPPDASAAAFPQGTFNLQNLRPSDRDITILYAAYDADGKLAAMKQKTITLPAFDIKTPNQSTLITPSPETVRKMSRIQPYLVNADGAALLALKPQENYHVPADTANALYTDYTAPVQEQ